MEKRLQKPYLTNENLLMAQAYGKLNVKPC